MREDREALNGMNCEQLEKYVAAHWSGMAGYGRSIALSIMVDKACQDAAPYLLKLLESDDPFLRGEALSGLAKLGRREYRKLFIEHHLRDPDPETRADALWSLSGLFAKHRDAEILRLALTAFDDPQSSLETRVHAADAMLLQLGEPPALGTPPYWRDDEEATLQHPAMVWAVSETRRLLALQGD